MQVMTEFWWIHTRKPTDLRLLRGQCCTVGVPSAAGQLPPFRQNNSPCCLSVVEACLHQHTRAHTSITRGGLVALKALTHATKQPNTRWGQLTAKKGTMVIHQCEQCAFKSTNKSALDVHSRTHTGEKVGHPSHPTLLPKDFISTAQFNSTPTVHGRVALGFASRLLAETRAGHGHTTAMTRAV
jgi:hypothetical protein